MSARNTNCIAATTDMVLEHKKDKILERNMSRLELKRLGSFCLNAKQRIVKKQQNSVKNHKIADFYSQAPIGY